MPASKVLLVSAALAVLAFSGARAATDQSAPTGDGPPDAEKLQEVTITAGRSELAPRVRTFVNQIVVPENNGDDGIARWQDTPMCPLVSGLTREQGELILERLSEIARDAAVPLADAHCRPNLYILVNPQPEDLLRGMEKRNRAFTFGYDMSLYPPVETAASVVDEFIRTPRAVRVWYNADVKDPWGQPIVYCCPPSAPCEPGVFFRCGQGHPGGSHVMLSAFPMFSRVFVIVDRTRLQGVESGQLADYVAMVGFAKLKPDARLSDAPTILTLFNGAAQDAPTGMTLWDQAFLRSMYA